MRRSAIAILALALAGQPDRRIAPAPGRETARANLPPLSYTCPMDPDVVEGKPGVCPRCGMTLEPVRLDSAFSCPVHTTVVETAGGRCPVCRRELVPITVSLSFTCADDLRVREMSPGTCADGSARVVVRERRVHGDHNPRHGGQFFMAPDNWHHLEGTYPAAGVFRVYLYDDFTRPLPRRLLKDAHGRAFVSDTSGRPADGDPGVPLRVARDGRALEARVSASLPARIAIRVSFIPGGPEHRFDFAFPAYTREPKPGAATAAAAPPPPSANSGPLSAAASDAATLLAQLVEHRRAVDAAVSSGSYGAVYIPALAAKDAALQLEAIGTGLQAAQKTRISAAVKQVVVAAWLLDRYGDLGDRQKIEESLRVFDDGVDALMKQYGR